METHRKWLIWAGRFLVLALGLLLVAGCAPKPPKGVAVNVLRPLSVEEGRNCGEVTLVYLGSDKVMVDQGVALTPGEKSKMAAIIGELCDKTQFLTATGIPPDVDDEFHEMIVRVHDFKVTTKRDELNITRTARLDLTVKMARKGASEVCFTRTAQQEKRASVRVARENQLASAFQLKMDIFRDVMEEVVSNFVPAKVRTFRPVKGGGDEIDKAAELMDGGNCSTALSLVGPFAEKNPKDPAAMYDAGVAAECVASGLVEQEKKVKFLVDAFNYYNAALMASPGDPEIQRAHREVKESLELYRTAWKKQKGAKKKHLELLKSLDAPKQF